MFKPYKSVSLSPGGSICRVVFLKKFISFSLMLALTLSTLAFNPNAGPPTLADGENPTSGNWTDSSNYDTSWHDNPDENENYVITDEDDLAGLAYLVNSGTDDFAGKKIELTADLDLGAHHWVPIGLGNEYENWELVNVFKGSFDGGNHTIQNMKIGEEGSPEDRYDHSGLFGYVSSSGLKANEEVKIENITIGDGSYIYTSGK